MLVLEAKLSGKDWQYESLDEAIRTANFVRNKALRYWMNNRGPSTTLRASVSKNDLQKLCATLAKEFEWAKKLNSQARQSAADRAWNGISRFYQNCKEQKHRKGYPKFVRCRKLSVNEWRTCFLADSVLLSPRKRVLDSGHVDSK